MKKTIITLSLILASSIGNLAFASPEVDSNKDIENALVANIGELSAWIKTAANNTGNFLSEQTPLYVQEYVNWYFYSNLAWIAFGTVMPLILGIIFLISLNKSSKYVWTDEFHISVPVTAVSGIVFVLFCMNFLIGTTNNIQNCIKAKIAPRVLVVDHIKSLIK